MMAMGAELDESGRLVGNVLTLNPTPHHMNVDGKQLYAWCALDTLFLPAFLGRTAEVSSTCPATGEAIELTVTPEGIEHFHPEGTVISIVDPTQLESCRPGPDGDLCGSMNFFVSRDAGEQWRKQHPHTAIFTLDEAYPMAKANIELMRPLL